MGGISTEWKQGPPWATRSLIRRQRRIEAGPVWQGASQRARWLQKAEGSICPAEATREREMQAQVTKRWVGACAQETF